jgi:hypothetical protein
MKNGVKEMHEIDPTKYECNHGFAEALEKLSVATLECTKETILDIVPDTIDETVETFTEKHGPEGLAEIQRGLLFVLTGYYVATVRTMASLVSKKIMDKPEDEAAFTRQQEIGLVASLLTDFRHEDIEVLAPYLQEKGFKLEKLGNDEI